MDFVQTLHTLEESILFRNWKREHPSAYLVHFFFMTGDALQIGYYESQPEILTTFTISDNIMKKEDTEIFKEGNSISPLVMEQITFPLQEAIDTALHCQKEKYPQHPVSKQILFLQTINKQPTYNITFVTETFTLFHILIHATTGKILSEEMQPLSAFAHTVPTTNNNGGRA